MKVSRKKKSRRFFIGMAMPLVALFLFVGMNAALLLRSGEYLSIPEILSKIRQSNGLYGSAIVSNAYWLKQEMYAQIKPGVVVLGSSRVLQFRKNFFSESFVNLGNVHNLDELVDLSAVVFKAHKPKLIILGVDFWWFNPGYANDEFTTSPPTKSMEISDIFDAASWLFKGKLSPSVILRILSGSSPNVGITAIARNDGFDAYGSYYNDSLVTGTGEHRDAKFKSNLGYVAQGKQRFTYAELPSQQRLAKFAKLLRDLKRRGIETIVFIPPLAPTIIDAMAGRKERFSYIFPVLEEIKTLSDEQGFAYFNFHDPRDVGGSDCEMLDGVHGGPVLYARLLRAIAANKGKASEMVNTQKLNEIVSTYQGHGSMLGKQEIDYLEIGCQ